MSALSDYLEAREALEHVSAHGWSAKSLDQKSGEQRRTKESFGSHDHKSIAKLASEDRRLEEATYRIKIFLSTREIEIKGCEPPGDCTAYTDGFVCDNLRADGGCRIGRKNSLVEMEESTA